MQPVRIGMNTALVLILLLMAVPLQLFFNHYLQQSYDSESKVGKEMEVETGKERGGKRETEGLSEAREEAMNRLRTSALHVVDLFQAIIRHYSSWENLKELFVIPYKRRIRNKRAIHISSLKSDNVKLFSSSSNKHSSSGGGTKTKTAASSSQSEVKVKPKKNEVAPTSKAKEVEEYMFKEVYFAQSKKSRSKRPSNVHFFVGQVVKHKLDGYHGIIIGWDTVAMAPDWWLERFYSKERKGVIQTPHYHILIDSHYDASGTPYHYIPGEDLEPVDSNVKISAPELSKYFEGYKDGKHIPRPWLRERYPLG